MGVNMFATNVSKLLKNKQNESTIRTLEWDKEEQRKRRLLAFARSIQVAGKGISTGTVDTLNEFSINVDTFDYESLSFELTRAHSKETITNRIPLDHEMIEFENHIKIAYRVTEPGRYFLEIRYQDLHVPCSPFKIEIQQHKVANPKRVLAFGKGLTRCITGQVNQFHLDTRRSGSGRISVASSTGDINDNALMYIINESKRGYQIKYIANTAGPFFFHIKLNGRHITGSPFLVTAGAKEGNGILEKAKMLFQRHAKNQKRLT